MGGDEGGGGLKVVIGNALSTCFCITFTSAPDLGNMYLYLKYIHTMSTFQVTPFFTAKFAICKSLESEKCNHFHIPDHPLHHPTHPPCILMHFPVH